MLLWALVFPFTTRDIRAQEEPRRASAAAKPPLTLHPSSFIPHPSQINLPSTDASQPIVVTADSAECWTRGAYEVWALQGKCSIEQGKDVAQSREAVVWLRRGDPGEGRRSLVIVYLEGDVVLDIAQSGPRARLTDRSWLARWETGAGVQVRVPQVRGAPETPPPIYQRALAARDDGIAGGVQQAQYAQPIGPSAPGALVSPGVPSAPGGPASRGPPAPLGAPALSAAPAPPPRAMPGGARRIRAFARGETPAHLNWFPDRNTNLWIAVIEGGVNLIVEDIPVPGDGRLNKTLQLPSLVSIGVWADRMVIWTRGLEMPDLDTNQAQSAETPFEVYMEGNIIFRQGDRTVYADRMYYDVNNQVGTVLGAEILTPVPRYEGLLRFKAEVLRQLGRDRFMASDGFFTSSRLGSPGYRLQAANVSFEDVQQPRLDPETGLPIIDPQTHEPAVDHQQWVTSENNVLFLDDLPVFYWPTMATDLKDSTYYIRRAQIKNDSVFGFQALTEWNMYQLLGMRDRPVGTDWGLTLDWLSKRGFGHGTDFRYNRDGFLGIPGKATGMIDFWGIADSGTDNLGLDRRSLTPESFYRFRLLGEHRQMLEGGIQLSVELGWTSDRNFLEQYYKREWDERKDQVTAIELKKITDNRSWSLSAAGRVNDFFAQTDWLPRLDHFWLGQPVLNDSFTWFEHSSAAYAQFHAATPPTDPNDLFHFLPWEVSPTGIPLNTQSERFFTRQEIDWPFQAGPVKLVPYALGEAAHWGEALNGDDLNRYYGQVGLRASIPVWRVDPTVESTLWNVHGLAHKIVFDAEAAYATTNHHYNDLPLYDPLDDDSIEAFRRRFIPNTFPGPDIPKLFDERYYAVRTGMAGWVTAPSPEIADDLTFVRLGMRNRWQTKRGPPDNERIVDWITVDTNVTFFPKTEQNFGQLVGLLDYDARWQVGDRLALLSSGIFDFFENGQRLVTIGGFLDRPPRGGLYAGIHFLDGPIHNTILSTSYSYRMSPKWVIAYGASIDIHDTQNVGQMLTMTRVGESFLVSAGFNFNASQGNWGAVLTIEPRFFPQTRLGRAGGASIPVAGAYGLE